MMSFTKFLIAWKKWQVIKITSAVAEIYLLFAVYVMASYDVFRIGRLDGDRRRRGILITSFVSLASLHSLMRTSGQERELIGETRTEEWKTALRERIRTRVIPKIRRYEKPSIRFQKYWRRATYWGIPRNIPRCFPVEAHFYCRSSFRRRPSHIRYSDAYKMNL